ncbi:MAG TPA: hypothetical protein VKR55_14135 [Bradyrhizobium sp.]|uniref:hypothetical protein n=1 Tax=Bradyrhizobium sp. TaxID=376 RepID=UPI002C505B6C|nr:hypothetical protein [Bradyrhizobium sp.]HLZ03274.1 hypothetical protein [Bradyrhizobium sp.]
MINRLIVPLTLAVFAAGAGPALAQGAFPAPLPNQMNQPPANDPAFPPVHGGAPASDPAFPPVNGRAPAASIGAPMAPFPSGGAAPIAGNPGSFAPAPPSQAGGGPSQACMNAFIPLRNEAEKRGKLIKAASERRAPPDEACKLIRNYGAAEVKMIKYVESNSAKCGIPGQVADQLKAGHKNTEGLEQRVCGMAEQMKTRGAAGPTLSEVLGSATAAPEATTTRKGGSTFDTLNGNVLQR